MSEYGKFQAAIQVAQDMRKDVVDTAMRVRGHRREIEAMNTALTEASAKAIVAGEKAGEDAALAASARAAAEAAREKAMAWAESPEGVPVEEDRYSALHYTLQAAASAQTALESALAAAAHSAIISAVVAGEPNAPDGGWYICRDFHTTAHFTRLRLELVSGEGDAGEWTLNIDGDPYGTIPLSSEEPLILEGISLDLVPGNMVTVTQSGGDEGHFSVFIQIDGRP